MLSMSLLYCYYKANIFPDIIILVSSTLFQIYDITLYNILCDCSHMSLHYLKEKKKRKIKSKKIDKNKIKSK